jgi:hypothetical protein
MDDHPELFGEMPVQPKLIEIPPQRKPLTGDDVRQMMLTLIARARAADTMPFESGELRQHVAMFPIMAQWLPPEEGEQLVLEFEREVERLRNAA